MTQEEIKDVFGNTDPETIKKVEDYLKASIDEMSAWVEGEVYGFILYENGEEVDSCWGFYGRDWENNGLKDYLPKEVHYLLEDIEVEY